MYRQEQTKSILIYLAAALFFGTLTNCYKVDDLAQSLQHAFIPKQKSNVFKDQSLVNEIPWTFNTCGSYDNFFIYFFSLTNQPTTNMEINYMVKAITQKTTYISHVRTTVFWDLIQIAVFDDPVEKQFIKDDAPIVYSSPFLDFSRGFSGLWTFNI